MGLEGSCPATRLAIASEGLDLERVEDGEDMGTVEVVGPHVFAVAAEALVQPIIISSYYDLKLLFLLVVFDSIYPIFRSP